MPIAMFLLMAGAGSPTYLSCDLASSSGSRTSYELVLNESAGTAGITFTTGHSDQRITAVFAPKKVTFSLPGVVHRTISVDRTDLSVLDVITEGDFAVTYSGTCSLSGETERKF